MNPASASARVESNSAAAIAPWRIGVDVGGTFTDLVLADAAGEGVRLVISVDTGIRAFAAAKECKLSGMDLIVTDHHLPDGTAGLPEALAVINPTQAGCEYRTSTCEVRPLPSSWRMRCCTRPLPCPSRPSAAVVLIRSPCARSCCPRC